MSLCENCLQFCKECTFRLGKTAESQSFGHHSSATAFLNAVKLHCYVCNRLFQTLQPKDQDFIKMMAAASSPQVEPSFTPVKKIKYISDTRFLTLLKFWPSSQMDETLRIIVELNNSFSPRGRGSIYFDLTKEIRYTFEWVLVPSSSPHAHYRCPSSEDTGSLQTWATLENWVQNCASTHSQCISRREQASWHPTRLIKLTGFDKENNKDISCKLVAGPDVPVSDAYVTLSHRWGNANPIRLTKGNLESFYQSIPIEDISLTFRQAMQVAGRLGVHYIWIDSLCIIQEGDGGRDWEHEASTMSRVYTNSFCNISADWASESKSLFVTRDLAQFKQVEVMLRISTGDSSETESYTTVESGNWMHQVSNSPLNGRGWFLQERLLAPRNLRFCLREVFWECCQMTACETYPNGLPPSYLMTQSHMAELKRFEDSSDERLNRYATRIEGATLDLHLLYSNAWNGIVNQYSYCQLTVPGDKLVAISGLARFFKRLLNDTYILGFWLKTLPSQLTWFNAEYLSTRVKLDLESTLPSSPSYRAPTFSWASVDKFTINQLPPDQSGVLPIVKCIYHRPLMHCRSDDDIEIHEDIFGPISGPTIELKVTGNLKKMTLSLSSSNSTWLLAIPYISADINHGSALDCFAFAWFDDDRNNLKSSPLLGQDLFYIPWSKEQRADNFEFKCLILKLVDPDMGRFARIGIIYVSKENNRDIYLQSQEGEESLPCWSYDSSQGIHTLYII